MKPDGGATEPAEATEALEAVDIAEEAASEEQPQEEASTLPPQDDKPENVQGAGPEALPPEKETNGKSSQAKPKTKAPVKTKAGTALSKITTSAASRPAPAQSRVANGATRTTANGATKKPANAALEAKKTTTSGAAAQARKVPSVAVVAPRAQTKVAEQKTVGTTRSAVTSTNSVNKTVATAATTPSKKPAGPASSVASKSKTTGPRPATAPAAKPSASAASKPASVPKTTRATTAPAPHSTTSSTSARPTITTTKPASSRTVPAPSAARTASSQASKVSTATASFRKDVGKPTSGVPARKPVATKTTTNSQPLSSKPSKPEPPKSTTAAKRPPVDTKTTRLKTDDRRPVPTQKVQSNISLAASSKKATTSNNQKQGGSSNSILVKRQTSKPTKSVLPLTKGKPAEEHAAEPVEPSSASEVTASAAPTAAIASAEPAPQLEASSAVQLDEPLDQQTSAPMEVQGDEVLQVPASEPSDMETVPTVEQVQVEALAVQPETEPSIPVVSDLVSVPVEQEFKKEEEELFSVEPPTEQEATRQEPVSSQSLEPSAGATVLPKSMDVTEKTEQIIPQDADEEEEEKEGSQQVSVSDMSGTQPTEESRPGSAGLAGSVWRAGGLHSELDSEDVSCSQQGASELSAPGVLEGTESMDDLGEASLKGADGEGVSAGSPDFEKVPDIPANEDDDDDDYDDDDRVCDMEVGSERADDPQRQGHDNGDEDEDEDVEMASEGITESGLESYGNADEDDFAEDYRLDNLNRMQPLPIVPSAPPVAHWDQANPFADPWGQPLQQDPMLLTSPSSSPWQANSKTPVEAPYQAWLEVENAQGGPSSLSPGIMAAIPSSPQHATVPSAENDAGFSPGLALHPQGLLQFDTTSDPEQAANSCSDTSTPEEIKDCNISTGVENQQQQESVTVNPIPALLQDTNQGLGTRIEQGDEEEEPETLPADDVLGGTATAPTSVPSSPSSATEDEASDTEGEMQISDPQTEPAAPDVNECLGSTHVAHSLSTLEEREEACVENEGGGGSDTPQSATSAASYGFDCTNTSNAHSTTESCAKSPGIFSLENEEQLPEEAKDPSLIKELNLAPTSASGDVLEHQDDLQPNPEQHYMLCGKEDEEFPKSCSIDGTEPVEKDLINPSSQHKEEDWDIDAQHPYYSTLSEKTDSSLAGRNICSVRQHDILTIHMTMSPKRGTRAHVDHVSKPPRLPTDLPPRTPNAGPNAQLRRLEHHQQQLQQIEQRREQQSQRAESPKEGGEYKKDEKQEDHNHDGDDKTEETKREEKEKELEEQRRSLLQLQIQQQQQELKQRQQIMQWQQELEEQQQSKQQKTVTNVLLSPSGLCTIYEALETSDTEEDLKDEEKETVFEKQIEKENSRDVCSKGPPKDNMVGAQNTCSLKLTKEQEAIIHPAAEDSPPLTSDQPSPVELDWGKKVDIVQQLINQTLLLAGDRCSPLLLLPGGTGGTLSPLETSLWPNLLPPLAQPSATVTSVSSFSPEASGSSPQGEWTVVELETHH